jgi:UDP-2,4-diacetamido-2,4,6-trideoxy-beta-L-altropyranose hydrolase
MNPGTLLIRADASITTGSGHVMRCLALAQAWQDAGGTVMTVMAEATPAIEERLRREAIEVTRLAAVPGTEDDALRTAGLAKDLHAAWVVIDGYRFDSTYQASLKSCGLRVLLIDDDVHADYYSADLVLNQNAHASENLYGRREPYTRLLIGPRYAMLRREFASWRNWTREIPAVAHRILITLGGSDPDNFTLRVLEALPLVEGESLEVVVVIGGSNPHGGVLEQAAAGLNTRYAVRLVKNALNMPELMAWADVAVSGAGTTCWEMCLVGLPSLVVDLARNQFPVAERLNELGVACHIGSSRDFSAAKIASELTRLLASSETRSRMCTRGRELVDGRGASRVCAAMLNSGVRVRRARESDSRLLWEWANEPGVRASAFSQEAIGWEEHSAWFQARLADESCMILIGEEADGRPIGQVRINQKPNREAEIDLSVARDFRGAGYGSLLLETALREAFDSSPITKVHAFIRPENLASARAFEKAGFLRLGEKQVTGNRALHYCRERPLSNRNYVARSDGR